MAIGVVTPISDGCQSRRTSMTCWPRPEVSQIMSPANTRAKLLLTFSVLR